MKFTVSNKILLECVSKLSKLTATQNVIQVLTCLVFECKDGKLTIKASDSENFAVFRTYTEDTEDGIFAVKAKDMLDALANMGDLQLSFKLSPDNCRLTVCYESGSFVLPTEMADTFPEPKDIIQDEYMKANVSSCILQEIVERSINAVGINNIQPSLLGMCFDFTEESLNIVATNGHVLVRNKLNNIKTEADKTGQFIVPVKALSFLQSNLRKKEEVVSIYGKDNWLAVQWANGTMFCRLIEAKYPNYNVIFPKESPYIVNVARKELVDTLKRVAPFSETTSKSSVSLVKIHSSQDKIEFKAEDQNYSRTAAESIQCRYDGGEFTIGLNGKELISLLGSARFEQTEIQISDINRPVIVQPEEQNENIIVHYLFMPIIIN